MALVSWEVAACLSRYFEDREAGVDAALSPDVFVCTARFASGAARCRWSEECDGFLLEYGERGPAVAAGLIRSGSACLRFEPVG